MHLLVRGDKMRASKAMQDRVLANPKITVRGRIRLKGWDVHLY